MQSIMYKVIITDTSSLERLVVFNMQNHMSEEGKLELERTVQIYEARKQELLMAKMYGCFGSMGCGTFALNCHISTLKRMWFHLRPMSLVCLYFITFTVYREKNKLN